MLGHYQHFAPTDCPRDSNLDAKGERKDYLTQQWMGGDGQGKRIVIAAAGAEMTLWQ